MYTFQKIIQKNIIETFAVWLITGSIPILISTNVINNYKVYISCYLIFTSIILFMSAFAVKNKNFKYYFCGYLKQAVFINVILAFYISWVIFFSIQNKLNIFILTACFFSMIQAGVAYKNVKGSLIEAINRSVKDYRRQIKNGGRLVPNGYEPETTSYNHWLIINGIFTAVTAIIFFSLINFTHDTLGLFLVYCILFCMQQAAIITSFEYILLYHYAKKHINNEILDSNIYNVNVRIWP